MLNCQSHLFLITSIISDHYRLKGYNLTAAYKCQNLFIFIYVHVFHIVLYSRPLSIDT